MQSYSTLKKISCSYKSLTLVSIWLIRNATCGSWRKRVLSTSSWLLEIPLRWIEGETPAILTWRLSCRKTSLLWSLMTVIWLKTKRFLKRRKVTIISWIGPIPILSNLCRANYRRTLRVSTWMRKWWGRGLHCRYRIYSRTWILRVKYSRRSWPWKLSLRKFSPLLIINRWGLVISRKCSKSNKRKTPSLLLKMWGGSMTLLRVSRFKKRNHMAVKVKAYKVRAPSI